MAGRMKALGRHLIVELYECDEHLLNDKDFIEKIMIEAAEVSRATIVGSLFHRFESQGVSGVVVISESHISIHTWPEYRYAAVDIFSCGKDMKPEKAVSLLEKRLSAKPASVREVSRGIF